MQNLGKTLVLLREIRGKNQAQLASAAGIGKSQLSKYENGRELPKLESLDRVLTILGISFQEFFVTVELVDERASSLSSPEGIAAQRRLLPLPQKGSLLLPETEEAFDRLQSLVLDLHRLVYKEMVFRGAPESGSAGARAEGASDSRGQVDGTRTAFAKERLGTL